MKVNDAKKIVDASKELEKIRNMRSNSASRFILAYSNPGLQQHCSGDSIEITEEQFLKALHLIECDCLSKIKDLGGEL